MNPDELRRMAWLMILDAAEQVLELDDDDDEIVQVARQTIAEDKAFWLYPERVDLALDVLRGGE